MLPGPWENLLLLILVNLPVMIELGTEILGWG